MEWSDRMNAAIDYIEDNLAGETDLKVMADKACCSVFHFQRMFFAILGLTPAEYVRRRKLTLAARDITSSDARIIDIAVKYGYNSPVSFARAFRNVHGINPRTARQPGVKLSAFPRISFSITLKGGIDMDYRIMDKPAFEVIARARKFTITNNENLVKIPEFWDEFIRDGYEAKLMDFTGGEAGSVTGADMLGICISEGEKEEFTYAIGTERGLRAVPGDFEIIRIPAATWAIFDSVGPMPRAIQNVTAQIFREWFPSTGFEHDNKPELEVYLPGDPNTPDYRCQVWIPVVKKN